MSTGYDFVLVFSLLFSSSFVVINLSHHCLYCHRSFRCCLYQAYVSNSGHLCAHLRCCSVPLLSVLLLKTFLGCTLHCSYHMDSLATF